MNNVDPTLRCYHFNNFYLAGVHAGIQAGHAQHELARKYLLPVIDGVADPSSDQVSLYRDWVENHKTMIVLNAGMAQDLLSLVELFNTESNPFPWVQWHESEEALSGCITSIAMVLPERIYGWSRLVARAWNKKPYKGALHSTDNPRYFLLKEDDGSAKIIGAHSGHYFQEYSTFEVELMGRVSGMSLAG